VTHFDALGERRYRSAPPQVVAVYGIVIRGERGDSATPVTWTMSPRECFRPAQLLVWAGPGAEICSVSSAGEEQLVQPVPAFLFAASLLPPAKWFESYGASLPEAGGFRVELARMPGLSSPTHFDSRTLSIGDGISVVHRGPFSLLAVVGRELQPPPSEQAA